MNSKVVFGCFLLVAASFFAVESAAAVGSLRPGAPFADGMVLQRDRIVPVWGRCAPGVRVAVAFAGQVRSTQSGSDGRWRVDLDPLSVSDVAQEMTVTAGDEKKIIRDVLVGEVWLCSGQSNMQQPLGGSSVAAWNEHQGAIEAALTDIPDIRFAVCSGKASAVVRDTIESTNVTWRPFTAKNLGTFSGVAYHFAMNLRRGLAGVPIGLVCSAVGGSNIRPWISTEGYEAVPELADDLKKYLPIVDDSSETGRKKGYWGVLDQPTVQFNATIAPIAPYAMRGIVWYQGESNARDGDKYRLYLHALAKGWRKAFGREELEFYTVQIMPYLYKNASPDCLGLFWQAQQRFVAEDGRAAYVVADDCGLQDEIHSPYKRPVGLRLALCALNRCYGRTDLEYRSPRLKSAAVVSNGIVAVTFDFAPQGVYVPVFHGCVRNFELAGEDGVWYAAPGKIDDGRLTVSAKEVPEPVRIRYMWLQGMTGDLYARGSQLMPGAFMTDVKRLVKGKAE